MPLDFKKIEADMNKPKPCQGCTTYRHKYHAFVPWMSGAAYDRACLICDEDAAWVSGDGIPLCDCHAEDWSRFSGADGRIHSSTRLDKIWDIVFDDFLNAVSEGYAPNDFKEVANV